MAADRLSGVFAALADPTRRMILARLRSGELAVTELARPFEMTLPAITKHLKVLETAGLIVRGRSAQWRPCRLDTAPLAQASRWLEDYLDPAPKPARQPYGMGASFGRAPRSTNHSPMVSTGNTYTSRKK